MGGRHAVLGTNLQVWITLCCCVAENDPSCHCGMYPAVLGAALTCASVFLLAVQMLAVLGPRIGRGAGRCA
jgi:hypothetical protein